MCLDLLNLFFTVALYLCNNFPFFTSLSYFLHDILRFPLEEPWRVWDLTFFSFAIKLTSQFYAHRSKKTEDLGVRERWFAIYSKSNNQSYIVPLDEQAPNSQSVTVKAKY